MKIPDNVRILPFESWPLECQQHYWSIGKSRESIFNGIHYCEDANDMALHYYNEKPVEDINPAYLSHKKESFMEPQRRVMGNSMDSSGRRVLRGEEWEGSGFSKVIKQHNHGCICEECLNSSPDRGHDSVKHDSILAALLATIRLVNINLLCIDARQKRYPRLNIDVTVLKARDRLIIQSEATAIFKGNFIRLLKNIFTSTQINRLKRSASFVVDIGTKNEFPAVSWVLFFWDSERCYVPKDSEFISGCIKVACDKLTPTLITEAWKEAFIAWKDKAKDEPLKEIPVTHISQINFDSIKNITF